MHDRIIDSSEFLLHQQLHDFRRSLDFIRRFPERFQRRRVFHALLHELAEVVAFVAGQGLDRLGDLVDRLAHLDAAALLGHRLRDAINLLLDDFKLLRQAAVAAERPLDSLDGLECFLHHGPRGGSRGDLPGEIVERGRGEGEVALIEEPGERLRHHRHDRLPDGHLRSERLRHFVLESRHLAVR